MSPPEPPEADEPVLCTACAAKGRKSYLINPVSRFLHLGPTCARRALGAGPDAARSLGMQLAFDLGDLPTMPRQPRRRTAVPA